MRLIDKMIQMGHFSFKYRGQIPLIIFILAIPIINSSNQMIIMSEKSLLIIKSIGVFVSFIGLLIRYFTVGTTPLNTSGKNRNHQIADELNTRGIYSMMRNPLYFANYIIWIGLGIYSTSYIFLIIQSLFFYIHYQKIILVEEKFLEKKYGEIYISYMQKTPIFLPNILLYKKNNFNFSIQSILKEEYSATLSTILSFIYIDVLLNLTSTEIITNESLNKYCIILVLSIGLTVILKTYKKVFK